MSEASMTSPQAGSRLDLGSILLETSSLTEEQLANAREIQLESGRRLADVLIGEGWVNSDEVLEAMGEQFDLPIRTSIRTDGIDDELIEKIPISF